MDTLVFLKEQAALDQKAQEVGHHPNFQFIQKFHAETLTSIKRRVQENAFQAGTGWVIFHQSAAEEATGYFHENVEADIIQLRTWLEAMQQKWEQVQATVQQLSRPQRREALRTFLDR